MRRRKETKQKRHLSSAPTRWLAFFFWLVFIKLQVRKLGKHAITFPMVIQSMMRVDDAVSYCLLFLFLFFCFFRFGAGHSSRSFIGWPVGFFLVFFLAGV